MKNYSFDKKIKQATNWIMNSKHLVVITGAGISRESGLPDFRGIWEDGTKKSDLHQALVVDWRKVEPNEAHKVLVELQNMGIMKFLISQNIDNLHLRSGIRKDMISEIHGNIDLVRCEKCGNKIEKAWDNPSHCSCGGIYELFVIKFGDNLPKEELDKSIKHIKKADLILVIGSSLITQPVGSFPQIAKENGAKIVIINKGSTAYDGLADIKFDEKASSVLIPILDNLKKLMK